MSTTETKFQVTIDYNRDQKIEMQKASKPRKIFSNNNF